MRPQVAHHFRCLGCGYDLYTAPLDGKCPECGKPVPRRKGLEKQKNPRRVNSQLRSRLQRQRRWLLYATPVAALVIAAAVASFWFDVPRWVRGVAVLFSIWMTQAVTKTWVDVLRTKEKFVPEPEERAA